MRATRCFGLAFLTACGSGDSTPTWQHLAQGFRPSVEINTERAWRTARGSEEELLIRVEPNGGLWVGMQIPQADWRRNPKTGAWIAELRFIGQGIPPSGEAAAHLSSLGDGAPFRNLGIEAAAEAMLAGERRLVCLAGSSIHAVGETLADPPVDTRLWQYVSLGHAENGRWRMRLGSVTADAIPVLDGFPQTLATTIPPDSVLHFTAVGREHADPSQGPAGELRFRVLLDDDLIHESTLTVDADVRHAHHRVELPAGGAANARITFEVEGPAALAAFLDPIIGPAEVGRFGSRPWQATPDILLFLADTFRADNMEAYGGDPKLTPFLNRFAEETLLFERARSTSTWTLPTHAALFSGYLPSESGVSAAEDALAPEAITVAEHFAAAGYRTGAITDRGFVSATYGLAQGFSWFHEGLDDLAGTEERVRHFLARDDGRPVFLFVQTYETHVPYTVSPASRKRLGGALLSGIDNDGVNAELMALAQTVSFSEPTPEALPAMQNLAALYRGTAADLDLGFERILGTLDEYGLGDARLVFTSDHGEALFEHGTMGHGNALFEENLRIPLFIRYPGVEAQRRLDAASSIDMPRTLAALAGLEPESSWGGRNLLESHAAPPTLSFLCNPHGDQLSIVTEEHKLITGSSLDAIASGRVDSAFDLENDPAELHPLEGLGAFQDRLRGMSQDLTPLFQQRLESAGAVLSAEERSELDALGYTGD